MVKAHQGDTAGGCQIPSLARCLLCPSPLAPSGSQRVTREGAWRGRGMRLHLPPEQPLSICPFCPVLTSRSLCREIRGAAGKQCPCHLSIPWDRSVRDTAGSRSTAAWSHDLLFDFSTSKTVCFSFPPRFLNRDASF